MAKPYEGNWVLRSVLFVPGHIEKMAQKAALSEADCVVLDLEDAVPPQFKKQGREIIREVLKSGMFVKKTVFVRINPLETGLTLRDVEAVAYQELHGFIYPMARTPDNIKNFDAQLRLIEHHQGLPLEHFSIIALIETPLAVLNAYQIATASKRMVGLLFGCEDFLAELEGQHNADEIALHTPRAQVALAARAVGIEPIDTPYVKVHDLEGLKIFARQGRTLGMSGMLVMSPSQIPVVHDIYTPSEEEITFAREVVKTEEDAQASGKGIVIVDGKFISPPSVKAARNVLTRFEAIQKLQDFAQD